MGVQKDRFWKNLAAAKAYARLAESKVKQIVADHVHFFSSGRDFLLGFAKDGLAKDELHMYKAITAKRVAAPLIHLDDQYKKMMIRIWLKWQSTASEGGI